MLLKNSRVLFIHQPQQQMTRVIEDLKTHNNEVEVAEDSLTGLQLAGTFLPDAIVVGTTDGVSQLKLCKALAERQTIKHAGIILMADEMGDEDIEKALRLGVHEFVIGPLCQQEFLNRLARLIWSKRHEKQLADATFHMEALTNQVSQEKEKISKYISPDLLEKISSGSISTEFGGSKIEATILFFDIRNSTTIAESLDPNKFSEFISLILTDIMDIIYGNDGSVNKFTGDGIMATFGCPVETEQDAYNALKSAFEIRQVLQTFNRFRPKELKEPISAGVGVASGKVFAGNIGSVRRMEYTVLGDAVNVAARLESLTKIASLDILIDGQTRQAARDFIKTKKVNFTQIRGKIKEVQIYHLVSVTNKFDILVDDVEHQSTVAS